MRSRVQPYNDARKARRNSRRGGLNGSGPGTGISGSGSCRIENAGVFHRDRWLFRRLNVLIAPGEFLAVMGPSGAGKSTLLGCLSGIVRCSEGEVQLTGSFAAHPAAMVFQDLRLIPQATLLNNVLMARLGRYRWWETLWAFPARDRAAALRQLAQLELEPLAHQLVCEVSGGEQQRTAVARALFAESPLLLADEPVASLNETLAERTLCLLRQHARKNQVAVVSVLHHEEQARRFADSILRIGSEWPDGWQHES